MSHITKLPDPPPEGWPDCMICMDTGIVGGVDIEFRFCLCGAGKICSIDPDELEMLAQANSRRTNLLALRES